MFSCRFFRPADAALRCARDGSGAVREGDVDTMALLRAHIAKAGETDRSVEANGFASTAGRG